MKYMYWSLVFRTSECIIVWSRDHPSKARGDQDSIFVHRHVTDQLEPSMDAL
jgi:hypothetical protein